jgi:hypothetical protein
MEVHINMQEYLKSIKSNKEIYDKIINFIEGCNGQFFLIKPCKEKGFRFGYVLYIPTNFAGRTMILHGNNCSYEEENVLNWASAVMETSGYSGYDLTDLDLPILVPVVSNYINPKKNNEKEFFPLQASRNVLFCEDKENIYYKMFDQLNNIIGDAKKLVFEKTNIKLEDKVIAHGFSSSAKFVLRYSTCFPRNVKLLIAGGFGVQNIIPLKTLNIQGENINLLFPIGVYDIKTIVGMDFDEDNFRKLPQFYFMGELETENNDTAFSSIHCDKNIQDIYAKIFGYNMLPNIKGEENRWDTMLKIFKDLNYPNIEFKLYPNVGHNAIVAKDDISRLIKKYL